MGLTERSFLERMELMGFTTTRAITNADRIRAMSDEELANWITSIEQDAPCPPDGSCSCVKSNCMKGWLGWLQEEAKS